MASPSSSTAAPAAVSSSPEEERKGEKDMMHKIKVIQFLGRTTPIVLQNDNGPCPLLAICNVLLLKNNLTLSPDVPEVSQPKLLSLVADRIFESNSNINDKDAGYAENQQQNIADAIDLLPRLTTGIDVNIKFTRIDDFEFTRECAIFDLLDIPLYHGWIVDPQDFDTANAIGAKSYNTLMGDLVALEARNLETGNRRTSEDDSVDFAAATTATLGVPSTCLSRGRSFDDHPISLPDHQKARQGDIEEEAELSRVLILSKSEVHTSSTDDSASVRSGSFTVTDGSLDIMNSESVSSIREMKSSSLDEIQKLCSDAVSISNSCEALNDLSLHPKGSETVLQGAASLPPVIEQETPFTKSNLKDSESNAVSKVVEEDDVNSFVDMKSVPHVSSLQSPCYDSKVHIRGEHDDRQDLPDSASELHAEYGQNGQDSCLSTHTADADPFNGTRPFTSTVDSCEPIYEGEDSIMESTATIHQNREPVYEGEVVLAEQGSGSVEGSDAKKDQITPKEGELIRNFLRNSASQLTIYGLFCLQEGLKERELCVFFRNNHFNTMFKFEGELYILATDLGYLNQPDLVWEKLNEVNGDTLYMTANFKEFKMEDHGNNSWDEQNAMTSTADYLASIDNPTQEDSSFNSDLQLAIALQQQEFEQQASQRQNNSRQPSVGSGSLVTGPQVSKNSGKYASNSSKQESKSVKEKCVIM